MDWSSRYVIRRTAASFAAVVALGLWLVPAAWADQDITSASGLSNIWIGSDLGCQVVHAGQDFGDFYDGSTTSPEACGTIVALSGGATGAGTYGESEDGNYSDLTPVSQTGVTGSGTAADPYAVTTVASAGTTGVTVTETDSYVTSNEYYTTQVTVSNAVGSGTTWSGALYHGGDCYLDGDDDSFGAVAPGGAIACAENANDSPAGPLMEFAPQTSGSHYYEGSFPVYESTPQAQTDYPDTCDCTTDEDSGMGINWDFSSLAPGQSASFSMLSNFSETGTLLSGGGITASGGQTFSGNAPLALSNATVATFTDSGGDTTASQYTATIQWGDGSSSAGTVSGGNGSFSVTGSHTYNSAGGYTITVTISDASDAANSATVTDTANVNSAPTPVSTGTPAAPSSSGATVSGSANPDGLPTTGRWEYGLDASERGPGFTGNVYDQTTPSQTVGSDYSEHTISTALSNLRPDSLYDVKFVATNSAGTTVGPNQTFRTRAAPAPSAPVVGKSVNVTPIGTVFILVNGKFLKLTQALQLPSGTVVDALHGSISLVAAGGGSGQASDAKAKKVTKPGKATGTFGGAVFKVTQAKSGPNKGLTTLTLMEGAYKGAPSYASCKAKGAADAHAALSSRALQTLRSRGSGRFSTRGRYAAGTVRGTAWTTSDRCNGTLIAVQVHSVLVTNLITHATVLVTAGHHYLAKPPTGKHG